MQFPSGHSTVFAIVDNAAALAWVANLGCIELHTWHSRVPEIEHPDYLLIDLDPTTDGQWPLRAGDRARRQRGDGRARAALLPEDVRRDRPAHSRADQARDPIPGCAATREGARGRGGTPHRRPVDRDDDLACRRPRRRVRRLRPERARPHDRLRLLGAPDPGRSRVGAAPLGRGRGRRAGGVHARDDGGADRGGRRPDEGHVAKPAVASAAVREARSRSSCTPRDDGR